MKDYYNDFTYDQMQANDAMIDQFNTLYPTLAKKLKNKTAKFLGDTVALEEFYIWSVVQMYDHIDLTAQNQAWYKASDEYYQKELDLERQIYLDELNSASEEMPW